MDERLQDLLRTEPRVRQKGLSGRNFHIADAQERLSVGEYAGRWFIWDNWDADGQGDPLGLVSASGNYYTAGYDTASEALDVALSWPTGWLSQLNARGLRAAVADHLSGGTGILAIADGEAATIGDAADLSDAEVSARNQSSGKRTTVRRLREILDGLPGDAIVVLASDAEGNDFHYLTEAVVDWIFTVEGELTVVHKDDVQGDELVGCVLWP